MLSRSLSSNLRLWCKFGGRHVGDNMHMNSRVIKVGGFKSEVKCDLWGCLQATKASEAKPTDSHLYHGKPGCWLPIWPVRLLGSYMTLPTWPHRSRVSRASALLCCNRECLFQMIQWFKSNDPNPMIQVQWFKWSNVFGWTTSQFLNQPMMIQQTTSHSSLLLLAALGCFQAVFW